MLELKDLLINARQESHHMRHFYLGVEHLVVALLTVRGGLLPTILAEQGLAADYVVDAIRRKAGKGNANRRWAGMPNTPRTDVVLDIAQELANTRENTAITERDLCIALLEERDGLPIRVIASLGIDLDALYHELHIRETSTTSVPFVNIMFAAHTSLTLEEDQIFLLRHMFRQYASIRIETRLMGGYTPATLLVVTPINEDGREDASVVVKIADTDTIQDEAQRYEHFVKTTLPPLTARLEEKPVTPDMLDIGGLKYTFLTDDQRNPRNLRMLLQAEPVPALADWLRNRLFEPFGQNWWKQTRPYRFETWQEYDWVLPPMLVINMLAAEPTSTEITLLRFPVRRAALADIVINELVAVENFIVVKMDRKGGTLTLALGQGGMSGTSGTTRGLHVRVQGINFDEVTYFRGEQVERISGRVVTTRQQALWDALQTLAPDFNLRDATLRTVPRKLTNPYVRYVEMLNVTLMGRMSTIHGDLHAGNIMIGQASSFLLIDFAHARDGHVLFDWATLETSLLVELLQPFIGHSWDDVRSLVPHLLALATDDPAESSIAQALAPIRALRGVVQECLSTPQRWDEYYVALALIALRASLWETLDHQQRRLMFIVSAVASTYRDPIEIPPGFTDATDFNTGTG